MTIVKHELRQGRNTFLIWSGAIDFLLVVCIFHPLPVWYYFLYCPVIVLLIYAISRFREVEISDRLGIYQSSVNVRATNAQWGLLNKAIKDFEDFDLEKVCG